MRSRKSVATVFLIAVAVLVALSLAMPSFPVPNHADFVAKAQGITPPPRPVGSPREGSEGQLPDSRPFGPSVPRHLVPRNLGTSAPGPSEPRHLQGGRVRAADAQNLELIGHIGGATFAVAVQGNYAYIGEGPRLTILDVSDPTHPIVVGKTNPLPDVVRGVTVSGDYAYTANYWKGLRVIDASDPTHPTEVGYYDTPGEARGVAVAGDYAYVADGSYGLQVVDVSDPAHPTKVGSHDTYGSAEDVVVTGDYAYVADWDGGLRVIDVSDPAHPTEVGFYDTPGYAVGVAVAGNYVYVADKDGGLRVINVSDPAHPTEVGYYDTLGDAWDVAIVGGYAYVADFGLQVVDVSDPAHPTEVGFCDTPGYANGVAVAEDYAYVVGGGLWVVDISTPTHLIEVGYYDTPETARGVAVAGNYVYVAGGSLWAVEVSDPAHPTKVGFYDTPGYAVGVTVAGNYAYVADWSAGLRVVDISNPADPIEVGFYDTPGFAYGVAVAGNYAYIADYWKGLRVVDVSDPAHPTEVGYCDTPGYAWGVTVAGDYAYVADGSGGLRVIDVSDPSHPTEVGYYDIPGGAWWGVEVVGDYAYVASGDSGLRVVDVSDPAHPTEVGYYDTPGWATNVAMSGNYAYVTEGWDGGLRVVEISNPANPSEMGSYDIPGLPYDIAVAGDHIYVASGDGGLLVLRHTSPQKPWTFILYLDGDNNLYPYLDRAIQQLEAQSPNPNVNILVLFDGDRNNDSWRFLVQPGGNYTIGVNKWYMGELDMGDPDTLRDFILWVRENYPAQHYYLAIADHGRGTYGIAWDYSNNKDYLTPTELRTALQQATNSGQWKIDVLHYDACLMALLENAYQVKDYVDYLVASQNLGWSVFAYETYAQVQEAQALEAPYEFAVVASKVTASTTPQQLAVQIADAYFNHPAIQSYPRTISALDLSWAEAVRQAVDNFSTALRNDISAIKTYIQNARSATQKFDSRDYFKITDDDEYLDLYHLAQRVKQYVPNSEVQAAAQGVMDAISSGFVVAEHHQSGMWGGEEELYWDLDNAHGVSIYFPPRSGSSDYNRYISHQLFRFTAEGDWDEFLVDYFGVMGLPPEQPVEPGLPPMLAPEYKVYLPLVLKSH